MNQSSTEEQTPYSSSARVNRNWRTNTKLNRLACLKVNCDLRSLFDTFKFAVRILSALTELQNDHKKRRIFYGIKNFARH